MANLTDKEPSLIKELKRTLELQEAKLEDGSLVTNKVAICQILMERALQGDLAVIELMVKLLK